MTPPYPFTPKSNEHLRPGQFFAVPLSSGRYAAGTVLAVPAFGPDDRRGLVVGLMDWTGDRPPTAGDLARRKVVDHGTTSYLAITRNGGVVLGERDLGILNRFKSMDPIGEVRTVWGWQAIRLRAEERFGHHPELRLRFFADFPTQRRAENAARTLTTPGEVAEVPGGWRVGGALITNLPLDLATSLGADYARMLGGKFAGTEPAPDPPTSRDVDRR